MPKTKCVDCGRICWNCRKCHNRTYCEFCNSCNLHGQDEPTPEMIRPPPAVGGSSPVSVRSSPDAAGQTRST